MRRRYIDDPILVEVQFSTDGRRFCGASQFLISPHYRLLGARGVSDPSLFDVRKLSDWNACLEVLGSLVDTEDLTISLSNAKFGKLRRLIQDWPQKRKSVTERETVGRLSVSLKYFCRMFPSWFSRTSHLTHFVFEAKTRPCCSYAHISGNATPGRHFRSPALEIYTFVFCYYGGT